MGAAQQTEIATGHILCVDDEQDILSIAKTSLEAIGGFQVSCCNSGVEALEWLQKGRPDLVLLDVMMPNMGGPSTLKQIQKLPNCKDLPVVFMTARVQPQEVEAYLALGASQVISKPFDPMMLSEQVQTILDQQQPHAE
ncbi:response regulator [Maritalea mediterranea]|uniref:Response regulator n=1 Tax=Maritalea mediterranea TaxID=2909667 RepID=A0ABS9E331_9HYPH|nr:response regulator [Maritalea mediterranea]MCF4097265.1 response regulator [Maritalea mediterranea]